MLADFVRRTMRQESGGRSDVVSSAGAVGAMQVLPRTFAEVAKRCGIAGTVGDPAANLEAGIAYLAEQLRAFGSQDLAPPPIMLVPAGRTVATLPWIANVVRFAGAAR